MTLELTDFKAWVRTEISADDTLNQQAINASVGLLGSEAGRNFTIAVLDGEGETEDVELTFRPRPCSDILRVTDLATITSVEENGTTLVAGTDYIAEPDGNRHPVTGDWRPYDTLYRLDRPWYHHGHRRTVTITGKPGWSTRSAVLTEALKVLTADWLSMRDSRNGVIAVTGDSFSIGARANPLVVKAVTALRGPLGISIA